MVNADHAPTESHPPFQAAPESGPAPATPGSDLSSPSQSQAHVEATVDVTGIQDVTPKVAPSFTAQEMQVVHRFCEEFMPVPDTGLAASGTNLARQLKDKIKGHVNELVRCGVEDRTVDPDAP